MALHYKDVEGKQKELHVVPGYELGWDIPVELAGDYKDNSIALADTALKIGYWIGLEASKTTETEG